MLVRGDINASLTRIGLDEGIAQGLLEDLNDAGVDVLMNTSADTFDVPDDESIPVTIGLKGKEGAEAPPDLECDIYLAAMGRKPVVSCGLAEAGATIDSKGGACKGAEEQQ